MISDTLSDACHGIIGYVRHSATKLCYEGIEREVRGLVTIMDHARACLDSPMPPRRSFLSADLLRKVAEALDNPELPMPTVDYWE
jgi:hypothetical protein